MKIILRFSLQCKDRKISILFCFDETRYCNTTEADLKICSKIKNFKNFFVSPTFIFSTQSKSSSRYCLKILRSLPQLAPLFCPERTATFWRDFSAIQSISVTAVKKRFWRQQAILSPTGHAGAPPAPVGRLAGTALADRRSANSWLSVLHAIPLVVQIVVGHLLSLVPTYVRLLVQRLSVVL